MIVEIAACGAALGLFARGIYHSGVLSGWIVQGLSQPAPPPAPALPPAAPDYRKEEEREIGLFLETGVWWLDPNRWGDDPNWRDRWHIVNPTPYLDAEPPIPALMPRCPHCGENEGVVVTAEHGGEASAWYCAPCDGDFTKRRKLKPRPRRLSVAEMTPPAVPMVEAHPAYLPCGCSWNESITQTHGRGYSFSRCNRCKRWWEPPSNGEGKGRVVAQGEYVHDRDDMAPPAKREWERVHRNGTQHHGVCLSYVCQYPVAKRGGKYYCTNNDCNHYHKGW